MAKVTVLQEVCKGCALCVAVCPKKILKLSPDQFNSKGVHPAMVTDMLQCTGCAMCATMCPDVALRIEK